MIRFAPMSAIPSTVPMSQASDRSVGMSGGTHAKFGKNEEEMVKRAAQFLRDTYPTKTAEHVASDTGISANTISKWLAGTACPNGRAILTMISIYGAEFLAAVLPDRCEWISRAALDAEHERLKGKRAAIDRRMQELRP